MGTATVRQREQCFALNSLFVPRDDAKGLGACMLLGRLRRDKRYTWCFRETW